MPDTAVRWWNWLWTTRPWWWPSSIEPLLKLVDRLTLSAIVGVLLYGLFDETVDNKDIFSMLLMIVGFYIGKRSTERSTDAS